MGNAAAAVVSWILENTGTTRRPWTPAQHAQDACGDSASLEITGLNWLDKEGSVLLF